MIILCNIEKLNYYINKRYGKLVIKSIHYTDGTKTNTKVNCICDCGNNKIISLRTIRRGKTKSCGCLQKEKSSQSRKARAKHNKSHTRLYRTYYAMVDRCYNKKHKDFKNYGARGITVCDEWLNNIENFLYWAKQNNYNDNLTIDRIDNNKDYSPNNCRFVNSCTQNNNRRNNIIIEYNNEIKTLSQWAKHFNIEYRFFYYRFKKGKSINKILNEWNNL